MSMSMDKLVVSTKVTEVNWQKAATCDDLCGATVAHGPIICRSKAWWFIYNCRPPFRNLDNFVYTNFNKI